MALERRKVPDSRCAASGMTARVFLKIVLDSPGTLSYVSPVPSAGGRSREASLGWDGSGACGRGHANPGLGRPRPIRGSRAYLGPPPSDPTAPYYGGAAPRELGSGSGEGRTRLTCVRAESLCQARSGFGDPNRRQVGGPWIQKPPRGTPGHWHPIKIESRSLASCSPRSLTSRRPSPGNARGIWRAPTSPGGRGRVGAKRRPGEGLRYCRRSPTESSVPRPDPLTPAPLPPGEGLLLRCALRRIGGSCR